jgi:NAD+ kinase
MKIVVFGKQFGQGFYDKCSLLFKYLNQSGVEVVVFEPFSRFLSEEAHIESYTNKTFSSYVDLPICDMLFSVGGDGTFLDAITMVRNRDIPLVGINSGRLGFLADIGMGDLPKAIDEILEGRFGIRELNLLQLSASTSCFGDLNFALNELAIHKRDSSSMITVHAFLNGEFLNSYWSDGLIVSTPTGSTAYSLSVGGPILLPSAKDFVITPIAPHNLTVRPLVVPNTSEISLKVEGRGGKFLASLDSRSCILDDAVELKVRKADFTVSVIERIGQSFYSTLRSKLMWGADKRN